jgi:RHS repeat-associated protein
VKNLILGIGLLALLCVSGAVHATTEWNAQEYDLYAGDFNGDGYTDILYIAKDPSMPSGIALSDSTGTPHIAWQSWGSNFLGINWSGNAYNVIIGDFNGDGKSDILLQSVTPGNSYLLLTSSAGLITGISQTIANSTMGLTWSADQHHIIAGAFSVVGSTPRFGLFMQATSSSGTDAIVLTDANGQFSASTPSQTWTDGFAGLNWSTQSANVFAGDFNGDGTADLLIQAKPQFVTIDYDVPFPVPTYKPNMNGVVLGAPVAIGRTGQSYDSFASTGAQLWSRMSNGVDWSPLTNTIVIAGTTSGKATVVLQGRYSGRTSYELIGNATGAIFPATATALTSNVSLTSDSYKLISGNFGKSTTGGLYFQALTAGGANYLTDAIGTTGAISASAQNPSVVTGTVEPTSAGRTAGQFSITPTGAATYNIPIWTPPGAREIEPHLALHYTSGGPDGVMGPGWGMTGISAIARCGKTWASTGGTATTAGAPVGVTLATTDDLCLDGNRLRLVSGTQGMGGSLYMTEIADFSLVTANGSASSPLTSFTVQGKDGKYYEYGNTATSAYSQITAAGSAAPYVWGIDKVSDRQGNNMVYAYNSGATTLSLNTIQYTATPGSSTSGFKYQVAFGYSASRTGGTTLTKYVAGGSVTQAQQLNTIKVYTLLPSSTLVRQYNLGYSASPTTSRPLLNSIQECGGSAGTDCIRPTTINYQSGSDGWSSTATATGLTGQYGFIPVDLNGDGIPDALYGKPSGANIAWYARIATPTGYGSEIYTGATVAATYSPIVAAFDGTGKQEFLLPGSSTLTLYKYNGTGFTATSTNASLCCWGFAVDWDGDGLPDLVTNATNEIVVLRNTTLPGQSVSFATQSTPVYYYPSGTSSIGLYPSRASPADFNGDGRADLLIQYAIYNQYGNFYTYYTDVLLSNGFSGLGTDIPLYPNGTGLWPPITFGDWNGDGCTDILSPGTVWISNCAGGFTAVTVGNSSGTNPMAVDWDGDGQTDLIYTYGATLWLVRSTGSGAAAPVNLNISAPTTTSIFPVDQNSDGQPDLMYFDSANGYAISYYAHNGVNTPPDLASSVTDGFGIYFSPTYVPISQSSIYTKGTAASFPDEDFQGPMYVVKQFSASDGTGGTYSDNFSYAGARLNLQGRGFEGFATTTSTDSRNGLIHSTVYSQSFPAIGAAVEDDVFQSGGSNYPVSKTSNSYNVAQLSAWNTGYSMPGSEGPSAACPASCYPYIASTTVNRYELGAFKNAQLISTAVTNYTQDPYGTLTITNSTVTDEDSGSPVSPFNQQSWITNISNSITNYPSSWCLGRPYATTSQKTAAGQPTLTRTVNHSIDSTNCRANTETVEPGSSLLQVVTTFGFDSCGNTNSVSVVGQDETGAAMPARTTTTDYNHFSGRCQFPEAVTNAITIPAPQTSYMQYQYNLGLKQTATDANGVSVNWTYDNFGRKTKESRPDSTATTWSYVDCVSPSCWGTADLRFQTTETQLNSTGGAVRVHETFSDGFDRVRFDEGNRVLGVWSTQVTTYDALGRKQEVGLPYSSSSNGYHIYIYDAGNRPLTDTLYTSSGAQYRKIQMAYKGQTATVTDPNINTITKITDVAGKLRCVINPAVNGSSGNCAGVSEPGGTTNYTYDSLDNLVTIVDAIGATSHYTYNIRGFKIGSADADTGTWVFQPDSLNELKVQTDANNAVTKFTYDLLGRMLTRLEPESTTATSWVYGTSASLHEIGQLHSVSKPDGYAESYAYDSIGRPQTKIYTEDSTNYQFDYAYNTLGAPDTLTYPTSTSGVRFQLKYLYDTAGYLNEVQDASAGTAFWTLTGASDGSAPTMEVLGNAVSVATGYTPWTNEMVTRTEGSTGSTTNLQNLSYAWDLNGNLLSRVDNRQALTEAFTLDALNRLSTVKLNGVQTLSVQYDQAGDITNKSDVGAYTYGSTAHPHAVTAAGSWSIGYDANGNMNSRAGGAITSYSYNLPNQINYNGSSSQFDYDSSHQRWKQIANYAGTTETIHYIGGLLQVVTRGTNPTEYRHQIPAGSNTAVYTRRSDGTTSTYYATSDHLGSSDLVMDSAANVLVRESFSPFGARRGSNWQSIPSQADYTAIQSTTRQGFTGHEMLDSVGLVHMNGRVYDPTLGRFLSADSMIQSLGASQSINPYSYAWNDPLRYTDPSGHSLLGDIIGLIVTIIVIIYAPEIGLPSLTGVYGGVTAAVAGFAGGFFGALVSTGSLSAAFTAGLISGITALAFYGAGFVGNSSGTDWQVSENVLAHAAVGCASAAASGGNCGKGALSAAIADAASPYIIKFKDLGVWSAAPEAAEAGLIGGVAARIEGGKFTDGFSVGAAGYLFNSLAHYWIMSRGTDAHQALYNLLRSTGVASASGLTFEQSEDSNGTSFGGEPDIISERSNMLWEVKPANYGGFVAGSIQMSWYTSGNDYEPGTSGPIFGNSDTLVATGSMGTYEYKYGGDGLIYWSAQPSLQSQMAVNSVMQALTESFKKANSTLFGGPGSMPVPVLP